mmetsp:Transcript_7485/g.21156  ORF Transcript_7485/g.21156 Transcript_7485/m.21156 type:complete len:373 (-) Transcript_7485:187-1305(-)
MLAPQPLPATIVCLAVPADSNRILEEALCHVHLTFLQSPNNGGDDAVISLDLERCEHAGLAASGAKCLLELIRAASRQSSGHQVLASGNDVVEDLGNVTIHVQPGTLDLLVPVVFTSRVPKNIHQHLAKRPKVVNSDVVLDMPHRDALQLNVVDVHVTHTLDNHRHGLLKHHALHLCWLDKVRLQNRSLEEKLFEEYVRDVLEVVVVFNILPGPLHETHNAIRGCHMGTELFVHNVPHPFPGLLRGLVPLTVLSKRRLEELKKSLLKGREHGGLHAHVHMLHSQHSELVRQDLWLGGAVHNELQGLPHLLGMLLFQPKAELSHSPGIVRCKNLDEFLTNQKTAVLILFCGILNKILLAPHAELVLLCAGTPS